MLSANSADSFTSDQFGCPLFLFIVWLLYVGLLLLCWIKMVSGHPCLVPDHRGKLLSFTPLKMTFAVDFSYKAFIIVRYVPSKWTFLRFFFLSWMDVILYQMLLMHLLRGSYGSYLFSYCRNVSRWLICKYGTTLASWE